MSQSPTPNSSSAEVLEYDKGWAALNQLIRAGRSFSGRERNCCFLNTGDQRFANVSAATGLDLADDGRGLSVTDWDHDGRLDFWVTNRNGPRVRFLKNNYQTDNDFISLSLIGTNSNRDAVGARVMLHVAGRDNPLVRTVFAGNGYLAQSSKRLHFGLGKNAQISSIRVRWPGGEVEEYIGAMPNGHFILTEGANQAQRWQPPVTKPLVPSIAREPDLSPSSRVVLLEPAPLPDTLTCTELDGSPMTLADIGGTSPLLINLWSTTCVNCLNELTEWSHRKADFETANLQVLAVCADQASGDVVADRERIGTAAQRFGIPFPVAIGNPNLVETLNVFQRAFIGRQSDLPLPSSILLDADGRLAAIYKGPVSTDQILKDVKLLGVSSDRILAGAIPSTGKWLEPPPATAPRMAAVALVEHGYSDEAEQYVRQLLALYQPSGELREQADEAEKARRSEYASLLHFLAAMMFDKHNYKGAAAYFQESLDIFPDSPSRGLLHELFRTQMKMDNLDGAADTAAKLLKLQPDHPEYLAELARVRTKQDRNSEAIELYEQSLAAKEDAVIAFDVARLYEKSGRYAQAIDHYESSWTWSPSPSVGNNLAWLLATSADETIRDGTKAVEIARQVAIMTSRKVPEILGTLAAALAQNGNFEAAASTVQEAIVRAEELGKKSLAERLKNQLKLYQNGQPFHSQD